MNQISATFVVIMLGLSASWVAYAILILAAAALAARIVLPRLLKFRLARSRLERRANRREHLISETEKHEPANPESEATTRELQQGAQRQTSEIRAADGNVKRELDDREKVEAALKESERRYRALAENTNDLICETDGRGCFQFVSPNYETVLGYPPKDLLGRHFIEFIHPDDRDEVLRRFEEGVRTLSSARIVLRFRHRDGHWLWFESAGNVFRTADGEAHGVVVSRDITERKRTEDELLKTKKMEALSMLTGGIAHDFNNFLTAVLVNISTAKMGLDESEDRFKMLTEAQDACLQARDLTQQLITFAKGGDTPRKIVSIGDLVRDTVRFTLRGSNVRADYNIPGKLKPVEVDEVQLSQVINNIVLNARQAMPAGGKLSVCAESIIVKNDAYTSLPGGNYVQLRFIDEGVGIRAENLPKVFDPYFTTKSKGSGLGLSISYTIIKSHGGLIDVDSQLDRGTEVTVLLPASKQPVAREQRKPEAGQPKTGIGRILVMDDEKFIRKSLATMLTRLGYEVELVKDGAEAQRAYQAAEEQGKSFDVVILDLTIPGGKGGVETMTSLRNLNEEIKAIITTGYLNDPVLSEYRRYGFSEVLKKPFDLDEVSRKIHNVMNRETT